VQVLFQVLAVVLELLEVDLLGVSLHVVDLLVDPVQPLATSVEDQTILLEIAKRRL
jgi:hypothetical protein